MRTDLAWSRRNGAVAAAFTVTVTPNGATSLPYGPLDGYPITWQLIGQENRAFASGERAVEGDSPVTIAADVSARQNADPFRLVSN